MGLWSEIIKAGRRAGDALKTMGEDQQKSAVETQKNMDEQFGGNRTTKFTENNDSVEGSDVKLNGNISTGATIPETERKTGSEKLDSEGMLTSDARCKNIEDDREYAQDHFDEMLNNTPDADPSNGLEHHTSASSVDESKYFDDDALSDEQLEATKHFAENNKETPEEKKARISKGRRLNEEEAKEYCKKHDMPYWDGTMIVNIPDPEDDPLAKEPSKKEDTKKQNIKVKQTGSLGKALLNAANIAGPDVTGGPAEITHFSGTAGNTGSKVLLSDANKKNIDWKSAFKEEGKKRLNNAAEALSRRRSQDPQVSFDSGKYSAPNDFSLVSDERLKEIFGDDDISCLAKIHSYDFTYKPEAQKELGDKGMGVDDIEHHGIIAQDLENNPNFKGCVAKMPDGTLALKTKELTAANTANIGDLARAVENLQSEIGNIKDMIGDRT